MSDIAITSPLAYGPNFPPNMFEKKNPSNWLTDRHPNKKAENTYIFIEWSSCFPLKNSLASSTHLINIPTTVQPSYWFLGKVVYLLHFPPAWTLCTITHILSLPNPSISLCFALLPYLLPFLSPISPLCDKIDYCSACASTCWISNRPLQQKPRSTASPALPEY